MVKFYKILFFLLIASPNLFSGINPTNKSITNIGFEENAGQIKNENGVDCKNVLFTAKMNGCNIFITEKGITYITLKTDSASLKLNKNNPTILYNRIDVDVLGADINKDNIIKEEGLVSYANYILGSSQQLYNVQSYKKITFKNIYPGVDWVWYIKEDQVKYDFVINDNSTDVSQIKLKVKYADVSINEKNQLVYSTPLGNLSEGSLISFQDGKEIKTTYQISENNILTYKLDNYLNVYPLTIDPPLQLSWGTYYRGDYTEFKDVKGDSLGNYYITGQTGSATFFTQNMGGGAYFSGICTGGTDVIILKFNSNNNLIYSTFFGGSGFDAGYNIAIQRNGDYYVFGTTASNNFPIQTLGSSYNQNSLIGGTDLFISKFNSNSALIWSTYFGGTLNESIFSGCAATTADVLMADCNNNIYIAGATSSSNLPVLSAGGYYDASYNGGFNDGFIAKFNSSLQLTYCTYFGGAGQDAISAITYDTYTGHFIVSGESYSNNIPIVNMAGAYNQVFSSGSPNGFISEFDAGTSLIWSTYISGNGSTCAPFIKADYLGNLILVTASGTSNLPVVSSGAGSYANASNYVAGWSYNPIYVARFKGAARTLSWGTYFNAYGTQYAYDFTIDRSNNIFIVGRTDGQFVNPSTLGSPVVGAAAGYYANNYFSGSNGAQNYQYDNTLIGFSNTDHLIWSTYQGTNSDELPYGITNLANDDIVVVSEFDNSTSNALLNSGGYYYNGVGQSNGSGIMRFGALNIFPIFTTSINTASICPGQSVTIVASGAYQYSWTPMPSSLNSYTTATVTANPPATIIYTVVGNVGCFLNSKTVTVTVYPTPTITVNSPTVCAGNQATLTANGASTYTWSTGTISSSINVSPPLSTNYTITGTSSLGCISSTTALITIGTTSNVTVNSPSICTGNTTTLIASGANTYTWSNGANTSSIIVSPSTSTNYTVTGIFAGGCVSSSVATLVINPLPTIAVNSGAICPGSTLTLAASGASTYNWSAGTSSTNGSTTSVSPSSNSSYTVTGTDVNGCINSAISSITVSPTLILTTNSPTICVGQTATLTVNGADSYTWALGTSPTTGSVVTANPSSTTVYTVNGTSIAGCAGATTSTVTIRNLPTIATNTASICIGQTSTLIAAGALTYTWSLGTTPVYGATVIATPPSTAVYTVTATDINGCINSNTTTLVVNSLPIVTVSSATLCSGQTATLSAFGASTYSWSAGANPVNGSTTNVLPGTNSSYTVIGTDINGCVNSAVSTASVLPALNITVSPPTICSGQTATLTASGADSYTWTSGTSPGTGSIVTANPSSTTIYTVNGSNLAGCTAIIAATLSVNALPNVVTNSANICIGQTSTLIASGALTYTWSAGTSPTNGGTVSVTPAATSIYTIAATDANGCVNSNTTTIIVNSLPTVTVNSATICSGQTLNLTASGAFSYSWSAGTIPSNSSLVSVSPLSNSTYTIIGIDINGCTNSVTTTVDVNPLPTITVNSPTLCTTVPATTTLIANGAITYTWSAGTSPSNGSNVVALLSSSTSYTVTGTDINSCSNSVIANVIVKSAPIPSITAQNTICANGVLTFSGSGGVFYNWAGPNNLSSNLSTFSIQGNSTSYSGTYSLTITDAFNCSATTTINALVKPLPSSQIISNYNKGCVPVCSTFSLQNSAEINAANWAFGDNLSANGLVPSTHCYSIPGVYLINVVLTGTNGCNNTTSYTVEVYPQPIADFIYSPSKPIINLNSAEVLFTDASYGANITSCHWEFMSNSIATSAIQNPTYHYTEAGSYLATLIIKSDHECMDTISKLIIVGEDYGIYVPNTFTPNGDGLNDIFEPKGYGIVNYELAIYDRWGENIFYTTEFSQGWNGLYKGEIVKDDVYTWKIKLTNVFHKKEELIGHVKVLK